MVTEHLDPANASRSKTKPPTRVVPRRGWVRRNEQYLLPVATILAILVIWEGLGRLGTWNPLFFSYPTKIWGGFLSLLHGPLLSDLQVSATEFGLGLAIALVIAVPVGILLGTVRRLYYMFDPIISGLYSTPILVLTPLLVIWFGLGLGSKVANVAILSVFPLIINIIDGVRTTDSVLVRAARSFGATRMNLYRDVVFPSVVPFFVTGLRLAIGKGLIGVVVGEYIAATSGIGFRIRADAEVFNTPRFLAGVGVIVVISVFLITVLKLLERKLAPWREPMFADE